ncbi:penicillin acylase family protein [Nocardioides dongxiaopingii]|uniref:penicillin acylase family protein n=1 Tax=Nocardioides sp. S-1144 TaxID=2582905 RepID=UPI00110D4669|nr:penicillin acylase family protein [Nocardioides sp. S-1144]QCW49941.1 penicillin acylase family protein [Nocardioides sp. S-1144]
MARIYRDAYGIPHVRGSDVLDVAHGQGWAVATDRAWQLEWLRRRATGTTAEVLGADAAPWDRFAWRVHLVDTARRAFDALSTGSQEFVAAYVDGVNAGLHDDVPELEALGATAERWPVWMPLATFHAQQVLFADIGAHLWGRRVAEVLGADGALLAREGPRPAGSNAWAVGGARTTSGMPLVGGDPHRTFESPGVYHQVRLCSEDPGDRFDVVGFSFAGTPGVQHFAHAGDVAWAITNAMATYQDLDDVDEPVDEPVDGPSVLPGVGFRGPSTELGDLGFEALLPLLRARTVEDVDAALDHWVEPVNNVVVADRGGAVRYRWAGRVPVRDEGGRWTGWRTDPHRLDVDADGQVVTANERRGPESAEIGERFAPPYRAQRIAALLEGRSRLGAADFAAIHGDTLLGGIEVLRPLLPERLRDWDGRMDADSRRAGDFATWRSAFVRLIAAEPVLDGLRAPAPDPVFAPYFDVTVAVGLALTTLVAAGTPFGIDLAHHAERAGRETGTAPAWGSGHVFSPSHPFDPVAHLDAPAVPRVPLGGDQDCVRCVGSLPGIDDAGYRGAVARYVWDLADRTAGGWVVPMGASGSPRSEHHLDQLPLWAKGALAPIVTDWDLLEEADGPGRGGSPS